MRAMPAHLRSLLRGFAVLAALLAWAPHAYG
jgi:hypothetical protein